MYCISFIKMTPLALDFCRSYNSSVIPWQWWSGWPQPPTSLIQQPLWTLWESMCGRLAKDRLTFSTDTNQNLLQLTYYLNPICMTYSTEFLEGFLRKPDKPLLSGILTAPGTQDKSTQSTYRLESFFQIFRWRNSCSLHLRNLPKSHRHQAVVRTRIQATADSYPINPFPV